jgi:hypothetical protein
MSPRYSSFLVQRCLKSEGDHINAACVTVQVLTYGPFRLLSMRVCLSRQFVVHFVETLDCIHDAIGHFEMVAESTINRESRRCKLQTHGMSSQREALEQKEILTLRAPTKASLHVPPVNCDFAHSFKSCVGGGESRASRSRTMALSRSSFAPSCLY